MDGKNVKQQVLKRLLPQLKLVDVDWKWVFLLGFFMFWTIGDDVLLPVIGELLDVVELPLDVLIAMILSRNTFKRAAEREAVTVQGKVVTDDAAPTVPDVKRG